jgi:hypothetical protein
MPFNFRFVSGKVFTLDIDGSQQVSDVKRLIHEQFPEVLVDVVKLIHRATVLDDSFVLQNSNIGPNDYIVVQPRSFRPRVLPPFDRVLPCPIPAGGTKPEPPIGHLTEVLASAPLIPDTPENAKRLQALMDMGFTRLQGETALFRACGNMDLAADFLLRGNVTPIEDLRMRHRDALVRDASSFEFIIRDVLTHVEPEMRLVLIRDPGRLLLEFELNPDDFDCEGIRQKLISPEPRQQDPLGQFGTRTEEREEAITRLMAIAGELGRDIVQEIYESVGRDEGAAAEMLKQIA